MVTVGDTVIVSPLYGQKDNLSIIETGSVEVGDKVLVIPLYGQKDNLGIIASGSVNVGDKVYVAPLYGQKDNLVVIGPKEMGITEGDYNTWTYKWTYTFPSGMYSNFVSWFINEVNEVFTVNWSTYSENRFGIYNLSDHSTVFESLTDYAFSHPGGVVGVALGHIQSDYGFSRSYQTYTLIGLNDGHSIEVWRGGSSPLWTHDLIDDDPGYGYVDQFSISGTGKYIMVFVSSPDEHLMLYEGSYVAP